MSFVLDGETLRADASAQLVGGKAVGLALLAEVGAPVAPFAVLTTEAWRVGGGEALPAAVRDALGAAVDQLGPGPIAVRSSASVEDAGDASWAGQFETVLGVIGPDAAEAAVLQCWRSAATDRVRAYASASRVDGPIAMAVVLQRMVIGEASGVMFSRDPDDPDRVLISAGLGLGEGVVQGRVPCDTWRVGPDGAIEALLEDKDEALVLTNGVPTSTAVDAERRAAPAVDDARLRELADWGRRLEARLGRPVDVEFTVAGGALVLLQVRPIAVPIPHGRRLLWDNSNIIESYSGITTPLTFSFASRAYTIVYQLFCRVMGVDEPTIRANEPVYRRMIGYVHGRIYYNLNAWYRVLQLLPGFSFNRHAMETMMGVAEVASDEDAGATEGRLTAGLRLFRLGGRLGWRLLRLERDAADFQRRFDAVMARCRTVDVDRLGPDEILALYEEVERELLWAWTPPLVNDFFCMIFYKLLHKRCQELSCDPATQLHNRLLAGEGTLASAAPAHDLMALARVVRGNERLRERFAAGLPPERLLEECLADEGFRTGFRSWMARYGDRSPDELKLESPTLADTPGFVLDAVRPWIDRDPPAPGVDEVAARRAAEAEAEAGLSGAWDRARFRFVLGQARRRVALRESLRFERTRIFGFVRRLFRSLGRRFAEAGALASPDDVFLLTVDEALGFIRGTTATTDLRGLVEVRRRELEAHRHADAPADRFHTWGAVHVANRFRGRPGPPPALEHDAIEGTPCASGRVTAAAKIVHDPRQSPDLGGAILVAHRTDPGWVPLYPTASGLLVERGSLLSHSAVVARELGLPAIIGVRGLLEWVQDGETLTMDGATGRVVRTPTIAEAADA